MKATTQAKSESISLIWQEIEDITFKNIDTQERAILEFAEEDDFYVDVSSWRMFPTRISNYE